MRTLALWVAVAISFVDGTTLDISNLPPTFINDMNNDVIPESTPVGEKVYTLKGMDPEGSPVHYGIMGTDKFHVDPNTGVVTLAKELDAEVNDTLRFVVSLEDEVTDGTNNVVKIPISVIISDVNDNSPSFLDVPYEVQIPEDAKIGSTIFRGISVMDPDIVGETLEVTCMEISDSKAMVSCSTFKIETLDATSRNYTGAVVLQEKLDYSQKNSYQLLLNASDGNHYSTTVLEIEVKDVQNNPPQFLGSLTGIVEEDDPIGTLVMMIKAIDGDRGNPHQIMYQLVTNPHDYFTINSETGDVRTAKPLDKESLSDSTGVIKLIVKAIEIVNGVPGSDPSTVTTAEATVTIKDVNDEPPTFNNRDYHVVIPENVPNGTPLPNLDMFVKDPDIGVNSIFTLRLEDVSKAFAVEPNNATGSTSVSIRVANGSLDYENPNQRKFIVLVVAEEMLTNPKLSSTATVTVSISDVNDNVPTFDQNSYTAEVLETATAGTVVATVTAKDRDSGYFGENGIIYEIFGNGAENFTINNRTGVISVAACSTPGKAQCLDYETKQDYFLSYKATDNNGKGLSKVVPLRISLLDSNDNPPYFINENIKASIDEGAIMFEPSLKVEARDVDKTSRITYAISDGNVNNMFIIDSVSGEIEVADKQGLEMKNISVGSVHLTVQASDEVHLAYAFVDITVRDVNNNMPTFERESYVVSIPEDTLIGTSVEQTVATDMDTGRNAEVTYRIQRGSFDDFAIENDTGLVTVAQKLDFDRRTLYIIELIAEDRGVPSLTGTATLTVNIINSNDKDPYFIPTTQRIEVPEDVTPGTLIYTLHAQDPDVNDSHALNFALAEPITAVDKNGKQVNDTEDFKTFFTVNVTSGQVFVSKPLERDIAAVVRLTVLVTDITAQGVQQGKGILVITITDVNDYPPTFAKPWTSQDPHYTLDLLEEQPAGTVLDTFVATDEDSSIDYYAIEPPSEYFEIHNITGVVTILERIDYESVKELNFTVVAYDSGTPQKSATAVVTVIVQNINDMDPVFTKSVYKTSIKENSPPGTPVITVTASDKDEGVFGEVTYSLIGEHSSDFKIDPEYGDITVTNSQLLDREVISDITIQVMASDGAPAEKKRTTSVPVHIHLIDINDNAPVFKQKTYKVSVEENIQLAAPILQVSAEDADEGVNSAIKYSIVSGNIDDTFEINEGIIYTTKSLLSGPHHFILVVQATDGDGKGEHTDEATVNIIVLAVNRYKPKFIVPSQDNAIIEILESDVRLPQYVVITAKAEDQDEGENGHVSYYLRDGDKYVDETDVFAIDQESGQIRTKIPLDREEQKSHELCIIAKDHGFPASHESQIVVHIVLIDTDDNTPEFPNIGNEYQYKFKIAENGKENEVIGTVTAVDRDEGKHAMVYYFLMDPKSTEQFSINKKNGTIFAVQPFDREYKSSYKIYIKATNDPNYFPDDEELSEVLHSSHKDKSVACALITVLDVNDNVPKFGLQDYNVGMSNNAKIGDPVITVVAEDADLGENGSLEYHITATQLYKRASGILSGSIYPSPFNISANGKIFAMNYMAEYNQDKLIIKVAAKEKAYPYREATTDIHVWVCENSQMVRVIFARSPKEVNVMKHSFTEHLSNVTKYIIVIVDIRYHIDIKGQTRRDMCDLFIHAVDKETQNIVPRDKLLDVLDVNYDGLKNVFKEASIENIVPAFQHHEETVSSALVTAVVLTVLFIIAAIMFFVIIKVQFRSKTTEHAVTKEGRALINKEYFEDLNTTENPLWMDQKLKVYEEQELTMQVFSEPENMITSSPTPDAEGRASTELSQVDNTYATIQHPCRRGSHTTANSLEDHGDYETLATRMNLQCGNSAGSSLHGTRETFENSFGFRGSTFQVPEQPNISSVSVIGGNFTDPNGQQSAFTINKDGQPKFVSELM